MFIPKTIPVQRDKTRKILPVCSDCGITVCGCTNCHTMHCDSEELCYYIKTVLSPKKDIEMNSAVLSNIYQDNISIYTSGVNDKYEILDSRDLDNVN
jgi:hypothetical protein